MQLILRNQGRLHFRYDIRLSDRTEFSRQCLLNWRPIAK